MDSDFDEPAYTSDEQPHGVQLKQDPAGFVKFLDKHASKDSSWADQMERLAMFDEFDLVNAPARAALFAEWAARPAHIDEPRGSYPDLVKKHWAPGRFYLQFKRLVRSDPAFSDPEFDEKQRETIYREYARLAKKQPSERPDFDSSSQCTQIALRMLS